MIANFQCALQSRPIRTYMLGLSSDTLTMQNAGWEFSAEQDLSRMTLHIIARNKNARLYAVAHDHFDYFRAADDPQFFYGLTINFNLICSNLTATLNVPSMRHEPVDMLPRTIERRDIEDYKIFATPLVRTNEIIVPESSVDDLLKMILEKQEPEQTKYYKQQLERKRLEGEVIEPLPEQKFHAQIVSIAA